MASIAQVGAQAIDSSPVDPDKLVMVDAYWIKEHEGEPMRIRILPQQKVVDLYVEFVYEYDDEKHDKSTATAVEIKFKVPDSCFDGNTTYSVDSGKLQKWDPVRKYDGKLSKYKGKEVYYYVIPKFTSDLYYVRHRSTVDEIVLKDAYWEKDGMKIRFLPQQKKVTLKVVLGFKYNQPGYDKEKAEFKLRFAVPGSCYEQAEDILIKGSDLVNLPGEYQFDDKDGNTCYIYPIEDFTSDVTDAKPKF